MSTPQFAYSNLSGRRRGPFLTVAGWVVPGVNRVQADVAPFAHAWRRDNLAALADDGPLWVALGDSMTQGIGASAHDRGWVGQARDRLAAAGRPYRVVNLGVSGARAVDVLERQLPALEALGQAPELVTVMIGSNDLARPKFRRALPVTMASVAERVPCGSLVALMPNPSPAAVRANASVRRVAAERGLVTVDLRDDRTSSWRGKLAPDHFHPNDRGYAAIAGVLTDAILRAVPGVGA